MDNFKQYLTIKIGLQEITLNGYISSIRRFVKAFGTEKPTTEQANEYITKFYQSKYSYSYKTNSALAVEHYMTFLGFPVRFGRQKKPKRLLKDTLTEAEITKMLFACKNNREKAIIALLAYTGIRNLELCNLKTRDIDLTANQVMIHNGKGLRDGIAHMTPECANQIREYLSEHPRSQEDYFVTTLQHNNKYRTGDVRKLIRVVAGRAKITKRVYPHLLRHSLATNMLNRGSGLFTIKKQLRHAWLETTMLYLDSLNYAFKNDYQKYAPSYL